MTVKQYQHPVEIRHYGEAIAHFAEGMKAIAYARNNVLSDQPKHAENLAGKGPYNDLTESLVDYIVFGPEKSRAAAMRNKEGLFGAFFYVHKPEVQLSLDMPKLLGEAGFKFRAIVDNAQVDIPLQKLPFYFKPRVEDRYFTATTRGKLIINEDIDAVDTKGKTHHIAAGTELTDGSPRPSKWIRGAIDNPFIKRFSIVDKNGNELNEESAVMMLWGSIGAEKFKAFGGDTPEFRTLARDGVDDDVDAQGFMMDCLKDVKSNHGVDLMPHFNAYIEKASDSLKKKPELLEAIAVGVALEQIVQSEIPDFPKELPHSMSENANYYEFNHLRKLVFASKSLKATSEVFGLDLPDVMTEPKYQPFFQSVRVATLQFAGKYRTDYNNKADAFWNKIQPSYHLSLTQELDVFDPKWLVQSGNIVRLKHGCFRESGLPDSFLMLEETRKKTEEMVEHEASKIASSRIKISLIHMANGIGVLRNSLNAIDKDEAEKAEKALRRTAQDFKFQRVTQGDLRETVSLVEHVMEQKKKFIAVNNENSSEVQKGFGHIKSHKTLKKEFDLEAWDTLHGSKIENFLEIMKGVDCDPTALKNLYTKVGTVHTMSKQQQKEFKNSQNPTVAVTDVAGQGRLEDRVRGIV